MAPIRPFKIAVSDESLERLHQKLSLADFPGPMDEDDGDRGAKIADVKRLAALWKDGYHWRDHEAKFNELPQFKTKVDIEEFGSVDMHFVHQKSTIESAIPLAFVHGWPGSFIEVTKVLPLLTDANGGPSFHVVAPSLPNFGFSERITKKEFGLSQYAEAVHKVMLALGYNEYVVQGGDWGFLIVRSLSFLYPTHVKAVHTNWAFAGFPSFLTSPLLATTSILKFAGQLPILRSLLSFIPGATYTKREMAGLAAAKDWFEGSGRGYLVMQSTKPQTLGFSLADSPVGLLGWIYEKLVDASDDYPWTDEEVLTWVSIHWFSEAGPAASTYIYKEAMKDMTAAGGKLPATKIQGGWATQPLGLSYFPKEIANMPKSWAANMGKLVLVEEHDKGGHFAAFERPDAIAKDLKKMFGKGGGAFGVVKGKDGY